ncbi:MAG: hypothetical protein WCR55_09520 [Lentisphaerota bacterium]
MKKPGFEARLLVWAPEGKIRKLSDVYFQAPLQPLLTLKMEDFHTEIEHSGMEIEFFGTEIIGTEYSGIGIEYFAMGMEYFRAEISQSGIENFSFLFGQLGDLTLPSKCIFKQSFG